MGLCLHEAWIIYWPSPTAATILKATYSRCVIHVIGLRARTERGPEIPFKDPARKKEYDRQHPRGARRSAEDAARPNQTRKAKVSLERLADRILLASVDDREQLRAYGIYLDLPIEITVSEPEDYEQQGDGERHTKGRAQPDWIGD